jgi:hypothetical protein
MTTANPAAGGTMRPDVLTPVVSERRWHDDTMANLCAHALVASTQAAAACGELAEVLEARGERAAAELFRQLAVSEAERAAEVIRTIGHRPLPQGPAWQHYSWLYRDAPNRGARKIVARLMTASLALRIALEAGGRVKAQYERMSAAAEHPDVRAHARQLAVEKACQLELIANALASTGTATDCSGGDELLFAMP